MAATATTRTVETVVRAAATEAGGREVHEEATGQRSGETWVIFTETGYCSGVKIDRWHGGTVVITREGKGGYLRLDAATARLRTVPVFVCGDGARPEPVATFGDSPRAFPQITDLGWFSRTDGAVERVVDCESLAEVAIELAFLHLS
jgi:hypothetical protein